MVVVFCWLALAVVFAIFGSLCDNKAIMGIGAIMLLMLAMVVDF